jgi:hypothetical protein
MSVCDIRGATAANDQRMGGIKDAASVPQLIETARDAGSEPTPTLRS